MLWQLSGAAHKVMKVLIRLFSDSSRGAAVAFFGAEEKCVGPPFGTFRRCHVSQCSPPQAPRTRFAASLAKTAQNLNSSLGLSLELRNFTILATTGFLPGVAQDPPREALPRASKTPAGFSSNGFPGMLGRDAFCPDQFETLWRRT